VADPVRTCVGCGRKAPQAELLRFAAVAGALTLDRERRLPGRGAYTCHSAACFERARTRRAFARVLRQPVAVPDGLNALSEEG